MQAACILLVKVKTYTSRSEAYWEKSLLDFLKGDYVPEPIAIILGSLLLYELGGLGRHLVSNALVIVQDVRVHEHRSRHLIRQICSAQRICQLHAA